MTTALQIIDLAYLALGYKDANEPTNAPDANFALTKLNDMLDSWVTQPYFAISVDEYVVTVTGATAYPVTIGPGMTFNVPRPIRLEDGAFTRINGVDFPLVWIDREQYNAIIVKQTISPIPCYGYYDGNFPTGNIYLWPVPTPSSEIHLQLMTQTSQFANLATDYSLPPGYKNAMVYSLAEELAPGIRPLDPVVIQLAKNARRVMRRLNAEIPTLSFDTQGGSPYANFIAGIN